MQLKIPEACLLTLLFPNVTLCSHRLSACSGIISHPTSHRREMRGLLTANRRSRAAVSQVNSFQLQEWISPSWISLRLSRQPIVTKWVDMPPMVCHRLPRKHCQSQANAFLATLVAKSCQGSTCATVSLSCESQ